MNKSRIFIIAFSFLAMLSCGPSASEMAKKSCAIYAKYKEAALTNDTANMSKYEAEMTALDKKLTEEYMHKNPEWLAKFVQLRDECIKEPVK